MDVDSKSVTLNQLDSTLIQMLNQHLINVDSKSMTLNQIDSTLIQPRCVHKFGVNYFAI